MAVEKTAFGQMPDGRPIDLYTLTNGSGMTVRVINFGATLIGVDVPDRAGTVADVTLGFDKVEDWLMNRGSFGATIGRYGNRIAKGQFTLDGKTYDLAKNSGENHIHGGLEGFHKKLWTAESFQTDDAVGVKLTYLSSDGEEGYPGNLRATVTYSLGRTNALRLEMTATTDKPTVLNLVNHVYWNLSGGAAADCLSHVLQLSADAYTPPGPGQIPTGEIRPVKGTPFDFRSPKTIGRDIALTDNGYDHNYVISGTPGDVRLAAVAVEPTTGRTMELWTDQPGVQFFSMNFGAGSITGKGGTVYPNHAAFCLETQKYPDSPNHPEFPSPVLRPGETYKHIMLFKFSAK
jgi:aldose 1-epimerase